MNTHCFLCGKYIILFIIHYRYLLSSGNTRCERSQNSVDLIYIAAEIWKKIISISSYDRSQYVSATQCLSLFGFMNSLDVSWLRVLITGLSPRRRPVFDTRTFSVYFVVEAVTPAQSSRSVPRFSAVSIILWIPHSHLLLKTTVIRRGRGRFMGRVKNRGAMERELFHIACHPGP
jgi:hypothetical protein